MRRRAHEVELRAARSIRRQARADEHVAARVADFALIAEHAFLDEARVVSDGARREVVWLDVQLHPLDPELSEGEVAGEADGASGEARPAMRGADDIRHLTDLGILQSDLALSDENARRRLSDREGAGRAAAAPLPFASAGSRL